jgi:hypothetical protein
MKAVSLGGYHWEVLHEGRRSQGHVVAVAVGSDRIRTAKTGRKVEMEGHLTERKDRQGQKESG